MLSDSVKALVRHEEAVRRLTILSLLYLMPALWVMKPVIFDPDIWWHLRTGQWILEHGTVPTTDPFSMYGLGKQWIAYSWLFEILVYGLYRGLGLVGILLYQIVLAIAVVAAVHRLVVKREPRFVVSSGLVALATVAISADLTPRPWLFTILFFTVTLDAVLDLREGKSTKAMWLLPPLYALWANLHIQFVYGLFILALACAAPLLDRRLLPGGPADHAGRAGSPGWWTLVALTTACFVATVLNPYHVRIYAVIVELAMQTDSYRYVTELAAPDFRYAWAWAMLAMAGAAAAALGRRTTGSLFEILLLAVSACFAFRATRDGWFLVIAAAAVLVTSRRTDGVAERFALTKFRALLVAGAVVVVLMMVGRLRDFSARHIEAETAKIFPVSAAAVVEERGYPGPLYNHYNWGGYLIWRLPNLPVAMDGRSNLHGDERCERSLATWSGMPEWASDPELAAARLVIAQKEMALASLLRLDHRFELVFEDTVSAVFIARSRSTGE